MKIAESGHHPQPPKYHRPGARICLEGVEADIWHARGVTWRIEARQLSLSRRTTQCKENTDENIRRQHERGEQRAGRVLSELSTHLFVKGARLHTCPRGNWPAPNGKAFLEAAPLQSLHTRASLMTPSDLASATGHVKVQGTHRASTWICLEH